METDHNEVKEQEFRIWSEGFILTGNKSGAMFHGRQNAPSFVEACTKFFAIKGHDLSNNYNPIRLTFWGCRLFDNETDARKTFG